MVKTQSDCDGAINYEWPEDATYETLTVNIICASAGTADIMNRAKMNEQIGYQHQTEKQMDSKTESEVQTSFQHNVDQATTASSSWLPDGINNGNI